MPTAWNDDPPGYEPRILANAAEALRSIAGGADRRDPPTADMALRWHEQLYDGVPLPVAYYAGQVRNSDPQLPELYGYEVAVGPFSGAPSGLVPQELARFETRAQAAVAGIDAGIAAGEQPGTPSALYSVLALCSVLHGEWVRIHPFANGNGRTARLWGNWAALRYGLPAFIAIKPRPVGSPYGLAAMASMQGDHQPAIAVFEQMLRAHLRR
ncbi:MAG: Fic family protein [Thermoleophilaceae bacterium]|nr:Fic family protein [Thermoleophilaceae bacterium]